MTLDEHILAEAKEVRQHLVDLESQTAHARVDYHHAIKKLHAAGGSLREIAEALELSLASVGTTLSRARKRLVEAYEELRGKSEGRRIV